MFIRHDRRRRPLLPAGCLLVACVALVGCGAEPEEELTEFDLIPPPPLMSEVELGMFVIPVPGETLDNDQQSEQRNFLQLQFTLLGVVDPEDESNTLRLAERRRDELRDRVITVCRNTSLRELSDPQLLTLKLRLIDATQPMFEEVMLDSLLLRDLMVEAL